MQWVYAGIAGAIGIPLLWAAWRTRTPLRRLLSSAGQGIGGLVLVHLLGGFTGVVLGFSWLCIGVSAVLGLPGVAMLVVLDGILK